MYLNLIVERKIPDQNHVFERALNIWGLETNNGDNIWNLYERYLQDEDKVLVAMRRRISLPLKDMDQTYAKYSKLEPDSVKLARATQKYDITKENYEICLVVFTR